MKPFIHARLHPDADDDLVAWLESLPEGRRSEALRALLRDGLRARSLQAELVTAVRQAVVEALAGVQVVAAQQGVSLDTNEVEEAFGEKLDRLLDRFK